jgi:succinate-acetate transporter protein
MEHIVELDSLRFPIFNYKRHANFAISPIDLFSIAFGLYMIAAPMMGWIDYNSPTLASALCFGGLCEYLVGFYKWHENQGVGSFLSFAYGLLHLTIYFTSELGKYSIPVPYTYRTYMQGTFYCLWLAMLFAYMFAVSRAGCTSIFTVFCLALATIFAMIWHFSDATWSRKASGYVLFIAACLFFIASIIKFIAGILRRPFVH